MTLVERIEAQYLMAQNEIKRTMTLEPQTPQARYDRKKAIAAGRVPRKFTGQLEKIAHEMDHEKRWVLKGVQMTLDFIKENFGRFTSDPIEEVVGDVQEALNGRRETFTEETD